MPEKIIKVNIKTIANVIICLIFVLVVILPILFCWLSYIGYTIETESITFYIFLITFLHVCWVAIDSRFGNQHDNILFNVIMSLLLPFSIFFHSCYLLSINSIFGYLFSFIYITCCGILTFKYGKPFILKVLSIIFSFIILLPIMFFSFMGFMMTLTDFVQVKTVQSVESPTDKYIANVIKHDEGALGGSTIVDVYENFEIDLILFVIRKKVKRIDSGSSVEADNMNIYWKNDDILVVNSTEYEINNSIQLK